MFMFQLESCRNSSVRVFLYWVKTNLERLGKGAIVPYISTLPPFLSMYRVRYFMHFVRLEILTVFRIRNGLGEDPDPIIYLKTDPLRIQFRIRNTVWSPWFITIFRTVCDILNLVQGPTVPKIRRPSSVTCSSTWRRTTRPPTTSPPTQTSSGSCATPTKCSPFIRYQARSSCTSAISLKRTLNLTFSLHLFFPLPFHLFF
jgi:hypothetical protein